MTLVVGLDEVGRGALAGPVVAGAVVLEASIAGLKDSKALSKAERQRLADIIKKQAIAVGLGWVEPKELDAVGLTQAVALAMRRALASINVPYEQIIIDGNYNFLPDHENVNCQVKADTSVACVSAASIVAKVARDDYMAHQALKHPNYGFENHVGYGTQQHLLALRRLGVTDLHRLSYRPVMSVTL